MANGFFHSESPEEGEDSDWNGGELFCVPPGSQHHFTALFIFYLKLNLLSALQIKQATFSLGVFFKVLLWWSNGIHVRHYREQNAENKTGKLSQGTRLKLAISRSQITSTSSMLAHSLAHFWAPITALIFHISLSDRLLFPEGCWISGLLCFMTNPHLPGWASDWPEGRNLKRDSKTPVFCMDLILFF